MKQISEREVARKYNKVYGGILCTEREKRRISREKLAAGIMSRTGLERVEKGVVGWPKVAGDTLMQRMGICTDYFETMSSAEELNRWRLREDICLLVPDSPQEAREKLEEYREKYKKREPLEEQFLLKAEVILMLTSKSREDGDREGDEEETEKMLFLARQAADCTIVKGWEQEKRLEELLLAPGELEAILLVSAALFYQGSGEEAWELQQAVWDYPREHQWKERMQVLILPQAAILGMRLLREKSRDSVGASSKACGGKKVCSKTISTQKAFDFGKEALELLRRNCCQCYVLPLLECICGLPVEALEEKEYLKQAGKFRVAFQEIYQWFDCPSHRIWQGISINNTLEVGLTLKMLRNFYGKSRANAIYDEGDMVITERQLEKIEKGKHKPSYENYNRLAKQYGKTGGWNMPLLEIASVDVLELRQEVSTLIEFGKWEEAEWKLKLLQKNLDVRYPRVRQELMFIDALIKEKKEEALGESLSMMLEALHCTAPDFNGRDMKWWVFQREEIMLASDIASQYRRMGHLEEAGKWFEGVIFSVEQQSQRTGVCNYGYDVLMEGYDNYLGDIHCYDRAVRMNEECVRMLLKYYRVSTMRNTLYRIAWNAYEAAAERQEISNILYQKWQKAFRLSEAMADFMFDSDLQEFLEKRKEKYQL